MFIVKKDRKIKKNLYVVVEQIFQTIAFVQSLSAKMQNNLFKKNNRFVQFI